MLIDQNVASSHQLLIGQLAEFGLDHIGLKLALLGLVRRIPRRCRLGEDAHFCVFNATVEFLSALAATELGLLLFDDRHPSADALVRLVRGVQVLDGVLFFALGRLRAIRGQDFRQAGI